MISWAPIVLLVALGTADSAPPLWPTIEAAPSAFPADVLARVGDAVVIIERFDASGRELDYASAFIAGPGWLITNHHCIEGVSEAMVNLGERGVFRVAGLLAEDREHDVVILDPGLPAGLVTPLTLAEDPAQRRSPLAVLVRDGEGRITASPGLAGRTAVDAGIAALHTTAPAWYGCSGAPVVDHDGRVVGVVNRLKGEDESDLALAVPSRHVLTLAPGPPMPLREWWAAQETQSGPEMRNLRRRADGHYIEGEYAAAIDLYARAVKLAPTDQMSVYGLAHAHQQAGQVDQAVAVMTAYLEGAPEDADAWKHLGHIQLRADRFDAARTSYAKSVELSPSADACFWLGVSISNGREMASAVAPFERALQLDPEHPEALQYIEWLYGHLDRDDDACRVHLRRVAQGEVEPEQSARVATWFVGRGRADLARRIAAALQTRNRYVANRIEAAADLAASQEPPADPEQAAPQRPEEPGPDATRPAESTPP